MSEFNTGLPNVRLIQTFIKDKKQVDLKLSSNDSLSGRILWQDNDCLCLLDNNNHTTLVWRQALVYVKPTG